jgi:hypothetical protein
MITLPVIAWQLAVFSSFWLVARPKYLRSWSLNLKSRENVGTKELIVLLLPTSGLFLLWVVWTYVMLSWSIFLLMLQIAVAGFSSGFASGRLTAGAQKLVALNKDVFVTEAFLVIVISHILGVAGCFMFYGVFTLFILLPAVVGLFFGFSVSIGLAGDDPSLPGVQGSGPVPNREAVRRSARRRSARRINENWNLRKKQSALLASFKAAVSKFKLILPRRRKLLLSLVAVGVFIFNYLQPLW